MSSNRIPKELQQRFMQNLLSFSYCHIRNLPQWLFDACVQGRDITPEQKAQLSQDWKPNPNMKVIYDQIEKDLKEIQDSSYENKQEMLMWYHVVMELCFP